MDLVTFGEAMVRLTPPSFQRLEQAHSFDAHVGGGELNVAVAAARLGVGSRWVSRLPENALGRMIANRAREQGVDAHVEWTADDRAGLYFAELGAAPRPLRHRDFRAQAQHPGRFLPGDPRRGRPAATRREFKSVALRRP